jgi:nitroreductase
MVTFEEVVQGRRSRRAFDPTRTVPDATLRAALSLAQSAPSNCNAQPWHVYVVRGDTCERLRQRLTAAARSGQTPEENATPPFDGACRARQVACAVELYRAMGIGRHDAAGRVAATLRNFAFFDAPHIALLYMDRKFGVGVALDIGAYLQTFLLALEAQGIGACAQASLRVYASIIGAELAIPEHLQLLCGVAFGYPRAGESVNDVHQKRVSLDEAVHFLD